MASGKKLSIVSPVYQASGIIDELVRQISNHVSKITDDFEIILVEDRSRDDSWLKIAEQCKKSSRVKGIRLSRNFGQHYAISAGLKHVTGDWIVVMDCDLQDRPDEISRLYEAAISGYEVVFARRQSRKDPLYRRIFSDLFHKVFSFLSGSETDRSVANFGIFKRNVIDEYNKLTELDRAFPFLIAFLGFSCTEIPVRHDDRYQGESSYTFWKLARFGLNTMVSNSNKPLILSIGLGFSISGVAFLMAIYNLIAYFFGLIGVPGFTTTVFSIWFCSGIIIFNLGILGVYIGKIFNETKGRPLFVIQQKLNLSE